MREKIYSIEKDLSIEKPDYIINPDDEIKLCYRPPVLTDEMLDEKTPLGKKYKLAKEICKNTQIVDLNDPTLADEIEIILGIL